MPGSGVGESRNRRIQCVFAGALISLGCFALLLSVVAYFLPGVLNMPDSAFVWFEIAAVLLIVGALWRRQLGTRTKAIRPRDFI